MSRERQSVEIEPFVLLSDRKSKATLRYAVDEDHEAICRDIVTSDTMNAPCPFQHFDTPSASSVLQKNTKLYGPMNALDVDNQSSSWNSEGNTHGETSLVLQFGRPVIPAKLKMQFQAGFSAESCVVQYSSNELPVDGGGNNGTTKDTLLTDEFQLEDQHEVQSFDLSSTSMHDNHPITSIKFVLTDFCDFYGRVILYRLEVWGRETSHGS